MSGTSRRTFLKLMGSGAAVAALPGSIQRALAVPAQRRHGNIKDVEHIIILTQENRSFDHYFGSLRGVRGFGDPRAAKLPSGKSVWQQPNGGGELLPFRPALQNLGLQFIQDPPHGWNDSQAAWNGGKYDQWVAKKGPAAMTYYTREDIPFHFALADAFTVCDAYYCSVMGPTDPNRYHMWTGWTGNDGKNGGPVITNAELGYDWMTHPERLQKAGITWKVYQDIGTGLDAAGYWGWTGDPYIGNYGDNSLLYFHQYQNAQPGEPLADFAKTGTNISAYGRDPFRLLDIFRDDVRNGKLPQVSWIAAPEAFGEHPNFPPNFGAWYIAQFIDILASNPEVWSKTALFINYDEGGGFFDHSIPPVPPRGDAFGASTVDTVNEIYPGDPKHPSAPYGLGTRVPMLVVSPWSKGGWVNSQVFDHTSLIRFVEARFGDEHPDLFETNITPWRRAVAGDLTSAFDFGKLDNTLFSLPSTSDYLPLDKVRRPNVALTVPSNPPMPLQEVGVRPARALPYVLHAHASLDGLNGLLQIDFANTGKAASVFHVRANNGAFEPRDYTVGPRKRLSGSWMFDGAYDVAVHGPNGFYRGFKGRTQGAYLDVHLQLDDEHQGFILALKNPTSVDVEVNVLDRYSGMAKEVSIKAGATVRQHWSFEETYRWYDLTVTVEGDISFEYCFAGHIENGKDSVSDPAMGGLVVKLDPYVGRE